MSDLSEAKVGDLLYVTSRWNRVGILQKIERVTPTGRVITKHAEYNPNGARRGESGYGRSYARIATPDDIAGVTRDAAICRLRRFAWDKLNAADLKAVCEIITAASSAETD